MELTIDPEFHALLIPLTPEERAGLERDIRDRGCRVPLDVWQQNDSSILIDGHNRYEICQRHGIPFKTSPIEFPARNDAKVWILCNQFNRRNLTPYSRSELALRLEEVFMEKAKDRQREHGGTAPGKPTLVQNSAQVSEERKTRSQLARIAGVSHDTIRRVRVICERADDETKDKLRRFGELSINEVYKTLTKPVLKPSQTPPPLPKGTYDVIYADPPWRYHTAPPNRADAIESHYPTLSDEEIRALQIPSAPDAVLFLWATAPKLKDALSVMESWGFEYKTCAVWDKEWIGMGYWFRGEHELLLVGTKGNISPPSREVRESSMFREKRGEHSRKPAYYYELIEKYMPGRKYLELFGRPKGKIRRGWTVWGNENAE